MQFLILKNSLKYCPNILNACLLWPSERQILLTRTCDLVSALNHFPGRHKDYIIITKATTYFISMYDCSLKKEHFVKLEFIIENSAKFQFKV